MNRSKREDYKRFVVFCLASLVVIAQTAVFAYIWYDETAEYYYYNNNGELIRWIDSNGKCHDNETDNEEYTKRGEKYWDNSLKALKGEGTKTDNGVSN